MSCVSWKSVRATSSPVRSFISPTSMQLSPATWFYNQIHSMLGFSGPSGWKRWIESLDAIEKLSPRMIVAGHRQPESSDYEADRMLDETRSYISDFADGAQRLCRAGERHNPHENK